MHTINLQQYTKKSVKIILCLFLQTDNTRSNLTPSVNYGRPTVCFSSHTQPGSFPAFCIPKIFQYKGVIHLGLSITFLPADQQLTGFHTSILGLASTGLHGLPDTPLWMPSPGCRVRSQ